ncbi:hypothetical protein [Hydrotalea sp.]|uniref:hypothetical protein n=1 Tax=Hydrotalea sp. TaxID=2881279 RepID=UPI003D0AEA68
MRYLKSLSQKEVCADSFIRQVQYSQITDGKVEPSISTLEKPGSVFEVSISAFFNADELEGELNLPMMQKIKND